MAQILTNFPHFAKTVITMDLLKGVLQKILRSNPNLGAGLHEAQILEHWANSVGPQIAKHAKAVQIKGSVLMVAVDHAIWKQELLANKNLALKKLNDHLLEVLGPATSGNTWITDLYILGAERKSSSPFAKAKKPPTKK